MKLWNPNRVVVNYSVFVRFISYYSVITWQFTLALTKLILPALPAQVSRKCCLLLDSHSRASPSQPEGPNICVSKISLQIMVRWASSWFKMATKCTDTWAAALWLAEQKLQQLKKNSRSARSCFYLQQVHVRTHQRFCSSLGGTKTEGKPERDKNMETSASKTDWADELRDKNVTICFNCRF